jgi:hypothetical protein
MREIAMSPEDLKMMIEYFDKLRIECNTPEKARAQLQLEGILDENGEYTERYRMPDEAAA